MAVSEDEFVVLVEHAGLVDSIDGLDRECIQRQPLLEWLEHDGLALLNERAIGPRDEPPAVVAQRMLDKMEERHWLTRVDDGPYYALRLSTTDAYRIYIEKDSESTLSSRSWSGRSVLDSLKSDSHLHQNGATTPSSSTGSSVTDDTAADAASRQLRIRESMWQDCFPTCPDSAKQLFLSFTNPVVVLYATLGLNLIGNGISSVPAYSRELKGLDISLEDRSVVVGFLSRAFPCE